MLPSANFKDSGYRDEVNSLNDVDVDVVPDSSASSSDAPRPSKRRRRNTSNPSHDISNPLRRDANSLEDIDLDDALSSSPSTPSTSTHASRSRVDNGKRNKYDDYDDDLSWQSESEESDGVLPSPSRKDSAAAAAENNKTTTRHRIFKPKQPTAQDVTFVTQLTQPHSSPSKIRGPRWKKPDPEDTHKEPISPSTSEDKQGRGVPDEIENDNDFKAAVIASLQSYKQEAGANNRVPDAGKENKQWEQQPPSFSNNLTNAQSASNLGSSFVIEDIPEDAFDTSPELSPTKSANEQSFSRTSAPRSQSSLQRQSSFQQNLRQTTLFGGLSQSQGSSSQNTVPRGWQNEPPTHHKLESDAVKTWVYPRNLGRKRDYQFNIAQKGLFHNLLVALPTGLGKTFIAATIMLNWFRWTVDSQIVFVAPTKPLVSQQVSACFGIVGIPRSTTTMLTGNIAPGIRAEEWQNKRVFFMTPQTLMNDLKSGIADPKRIVLLVIDEAHRATGSYAYVEVVKLLQKFNSSFRVLALTATPGSTIESVQEVIDGLRISKVEIRTEQSLDIREFVHTRNVEIQSFENTDDMAMCMSLFAKALQPVVDKLRSFNAYWGRDPMTLTPYGLTVARQQWMRTAGQGMDWGIKGMVNSIFTVLASLAHSIDLLKYHGIGPFYRSLASFQSSLTDGTSNSKYSRQIANDENFKTLMNRIRALTHSDDFIGHPKLDYLRQIVLNHFMDAGEASGMTNGRGASDTRIMVFAQFRDSAEEIVRTLKKHDPMVRPHVFVGQAAAKGSEGMDQKTQLDIIDKFKKGTYNTIVATSIGEEGLDIGEVDLIICYDSSASPIRMLQRMGRTGRKRRGNIILLLMKGKEEDSYTKAKDNYEKMQLLIASGSRFTFHDDKSPRILPKDIHPRVDERQIEIPVENSQTEALPEPTRQGRAPKRPPKRFNMPDGVETGFTNASRLGGGKKRKTETDSSTGAAPTLIPEPVPTLDEVSLSRAEQRELEERYRNVGGDAPQYITRPRVDAFPDIQRAFRPTKLVRHSRVTRRLVKVFRKMNNMTADCEQDYRARLHPDDEFEQRSAATNLEKRRNIDSRPEDALFCTQDSLADQPILTGIEECRPSIFPKEANIPASQDSLDLPDFETLLDRHRRDSGFTRPGNLRDPGDSTSKTSQRKQPPIAGDDSDDFDI